MKFIFILLLFISFNASAQKLEILLIGVSHDYGNYQKQDFSDIYRKIQRFKPTAFFGEFLSKEDEKNLMDYWCKKDNLKRLKTLRKNRNIPTDRLAKTIDSLKARCLQAPENFRLKTDLAHAYYLDQDVANGHYQYWQVFSRLKQSPDNGLLAYVDGLLSPESDTTGRSMRRLKNSEYALIAFPMMQKMGIMELLPMDCQDYDLNLNAAWSVSDEKFNTFKEDTSAIFRRELNEKLSRINAGFELYDKIEKSSSRVTEWLNTAEAAAISSSGDFYLPELYDMKNFPKEEMLSKIHWWMMRNQEMCNNVVKLSKKKGLTRVVVTAGANHRRYMQDIFEKMTGVKVRNINQAE
ncbi:DUF5694 domain-containing protein [Pedobacter sp. 22226]|uniref:DUF5694 domain-containing protein n=1 Tax=Pedobacter sp. 22226 TaxID=3453894 RepID=UPI003F876383